MAARPATLLASIAAVFVGTASAWHDGVFAPLPFIVVLVAALSIQVGVNFANDLADAVKGADTAHRIGPQRAVSSGAITAHEMKRGVVRPEHLDRTIRLATEAGLPLGGSQVYGFPGETEAEMVDSIRRARAYDKSTSFHRWTVFICQPLPGSQLWHRLRADGVLSPDMDFSTMRIDGDYEYFTSDWLFLNPEMTRERFVQVLQREGVLPKTLRLRPPVSRRIWRQMNTWWARPSGARRAAA